MEHATRPLPASNEAEKGGGVFPINLFYFLPLTRAFCGAKNR
jgi:hypothetical protein